MRVAFFWHLFDFNQTQIFLLPSSHFSSIHQSQYVNIHTYSVVPSISQSIIIFRNQEEERRENVDVEARKASSKEYHVLSGSKTHFCVTQQVRLLNIGLQVDLFSFSVSQRSFIIQIVFCSCIVVYPFVNVNIQSNISSIREYIVSYLISINFSKLTVFIITSTIQSQNSKSDMDQSSFRLRFSVY
jgi:hypothetical protein